MAIKLRRLIRPSRKRRSAVFDLSTKGWLGSDAYLAGWFDADLITLAGGAVTGTATTGQGGQSVTGNITVSQAASVTTGQGGQSVTGNLTVAQAATGTTGQGSQSVTGNIGVSQDATATTAQGSQSVTSSGTVAQAASVTTAQGSQSVTAAGEAGLGTNVTTGQGGQSVVASGSQSLGGSATTAQGGQRVNADGISEVGEVVAPVVIPGGGGQVRLRYPKVRIATPILPEPLRVIAGRSATGQGAQSVTAFVQIGLVATVATAQASQSTTAQADSNNLRLLLAEDEFWLVAA